MRQPSRRPSPRTSTTSRRCWTTTTARCCTACGRSWTRRSSRSSTSTGPAPRRRCTSSPRWPSSASPARQYSGYGCPGRSSLLDGMIAMELSRGDPSMATFMGVHGGLAMGTVYLCGSEEQKERWLPAMARMELIGAFGLTEPDAGSDVARGLRTTARRDGDTWVLDGQKKWIGNGSFADLVDHLGPRRRDRAGARVRRREGQPRATPPSTSRTRSRCGRCRTR